MTQATKTQEHRESRVSRELPYFLGQSHVFVHMPPRAAFPLQQQSRVGATETHGHPSLTYLVTGCLLKSLWISDIENAGACGNSKNGHKFYLTGVVGWPPKAGKSQGMKNRSKGTPGDGNRWTEGTAERQQAACKES